MFSSFTEVSRIADRFVVIILFSTFERKSRFIVKTSDRHHDSSCVTENEVGFFFPINKYGTFGKCLDTPGAL